MSSITALFAICTALFVGCVSPGPSFLLIASTSLSKGRKAGIQASAGMGIVGAGYSAAASLGLAALIEATPPLFTGLKVVGALYLAWLSFGLWKDAKSTVQPADFTKKQLNPFLRGVITQASNPKTIVVYGSIFAAFMPSVPEFWLFIALPVCCGLIEFVWYSVVTVIFTGKRSQAAYLSRKTVIDRIAATVMFALAVRLAIPY